MGEFGKRKGMTEFALGPARAIVLRFMPGRDG